MTSRERWLAALDFRSVDRLPFWPKLDGAYALHQAEPFRSMSVAQLHDWLGSDPHEWCGAGVRTIRRTTAEEVEVRGDERRTRFVTPHGTLERIDRFDPASQSWHPVKLPVESPEQIELMAEWYADRGCEPDPTLVAEAAEQCRAIGQRAAIGCGLGESALMEWVEWVAGIEGAHYLLADWQAEVEALFDAMHRALLRRAELILAQCPADVFYLVENTSTTLISPDQYRTYCLPPIREYAALVQAAGKRLVLHMCGHLKQILPDLATLPVAGFEAFTSPTVGNTRLADGRAACPNVCLIGGTNATLWLQPAEVIAAEIERDLDALPHHRGIVPTSAGMMPPRATPETIRTVCERIKAYPARTTLEPVEVVQ